MQVPYSMFQVAARCLGIVPIRWRLGSPFREMQNTLRCAIRWSPEEIREWQLKRLQRILRHAEEQVAYYRHFFRTNDIHWQDIKSLEDVRLLPFLSKQQVVDQADAMVADGISKKKMIPAVTGGSTGVPLRFVLQQDHSAIELAFLSTILERFACRIGDRFVVLRTQRQSRNPLTPFWTLNPHRHQLVISSYLIDENSIIAMANEIKAFRPAYILAIPSTAALFCHHLKARGESLGFSPRVIILGSENSYSQQREFIENTFKAPTVMHYGQGEGVAMAEEDRFTGLYHVNPLYGLTEIVDSNGTRLEKPGETGEIVSTSFYNFVMPLIRYRTGDLATLGEGPSRWGLQGGKWEGIEGRSVELVMTKDGRWIMAAALMFGSHDSTLSNVVQLQIEQKQQGVLILRIIKKQSYQTKDEIQIKEMVAKLSNAGFELVFEYVGAISKTRGGKHQFLIQHLRIPSVVKRTAKGCDHPWI